MRTDTDLLDVLSALGNTVSPLERRDSWAQAQSWRNVYASALHSRTGKWSNGADWELLIGKDYQSKSSQRALSEYLAQRPDSFLLRYTSSDSSLLLCVGGQVPNLTGWGTDSYIFPQDLGWTMAFTEACDLVAGPYFAYRTWVGA